MFERYTAIEKGFIIDRIDPDGFSVCLQCFLAPSQCIERDSPVDMGFGIDRIQRKRLVVSLQSFLVSFEVVQENAAPHPGIRGMGHDAQQPVNDTQSIFVAALFEVVIGDIFQRIRIKPGRRVPLVSGKQCVHSPFVSRLVEVLELKIKHAHANAEILVAGAVRRGARWCRTRKNKRCSEKKVRRIIAGYYTIYKEFALSG